MKRQLKFALRRGVSVSGVSAQIIGEELSKIATKHDGLRAKTVVDEARPDAAALHPVFEWDDGVAGEFWREHQARNLIRAVEVIKQTDEGVVRAPMFVHVPNSSSSSTGVYEPVSVVVSQPDKFLLALSALQRQVDQAQEAVKTLQREATGGSIAAEKLAALNVAAIALQTAKDAVATLQ